MTTPQPLICWRCTFWCSALIRYLIRNPNGPKSWEQLCTSVDKVRKRMEGIKKEGFEGVKCGYKLYSGNVKLKDCLKGGFVIELWYRKRKIWSHYVYKVGLHVVLQTTFALVDGMKYQTFLNLKPKLVSINSTLSNKMVNTPPPPQKQKQNTPQEKMTRSKTTKKLTILFPFFFYPWFNVETVTWSAST